MNDIKKEQIYQEYHNKVYGYILGKTNHSLDAEDIAADVFVKVYEKYDTFDSNKASISTWIYTIAHNTLIDYYRTHKDYCEIPDSIEEESSVEDDICNAEMLEALANALERLNARERSVVVQRYYYGRTLKDIAAEMGISYSYVKVLQAKALDSLRTYLTLA